MCGIAGYYKVKPDYNEINSIIQRMNQSQIHRGPNSTNKFINKEINLGLMMCRLSILDLEFGVQPMHSEDGRYTIIFNGTILNSPSLRSEIEEKKIMGHPAATFQQPPKFNPPLTDRQEKILSDSSH